VPPFCSRPRRARRAASANEPKDPPESGQKKLVDPTIGAVRKVADFAVFHTQILDADGNASGTLPPFARDAGQLRAMYKLMALTRAYDKKAVALQRTGQLGTYASCLGQEAIGTAIGYALRDEDIFIPAYREYAAQFKRGVPMENVMLYWGGDERGMAYESGPALHDFPLSVPIGTHVPHAIGVGYALKLRGEPRVVLASCGDGATAPAGLGLSDLMYSINCKTPSSVTSPWNVGMIGWNPATTLAFGCRIDSRM